MSRWGETFAALSGGSDTLDTVLLSDPGLVGKPDLYRGRIDRRVARELVDNLGEAFLKSSMTPTSSPTSLTRA